MSTPKTPRNTINLSKCEVGRRVRLRNGRGATFVKRNKGRCIFPFAYQVDGAQSTIAVNRYGSYLNSSETHDFDIVSILPLAKKKPAKTPLECSAKLMSKKDVQAAIIHTRAILKLLEAQL